MSKVVITTTEDGSIFTQRTNEDGSPKMDKNGKPFGYIRVENPSSIDLQYAYQNGGIKRGQSALISMSVEGWNKAKAFYIAEHAKALKEGKTGMEIPGRVQILESLVQGEGYKAKLAGKDGQACTLDGQPIYRRTEFDATGLAADVLIAHNNEIKGSNAAVEVDAKEALNGKKVK